MRMRRGQDCFDGRTFVMRHSSIAWTMHGEFEPFQCCIPEVSLAVRSASVLKEFALCFAKK